MKWRSVLPIGLLGMTALASCDCDHEEDMSAISELQVGSVVCADGTVLSEKRFEESGKEAMGIVFYVDSDNELGNLGYAVYIHDIEPLAFADTLGVDQETSASLSEEDGNENTYSLFHCEDVASPMAIKVFDILIPKYPIPKSTQDVPVHLFRKVSCRCKITQERHRNPIGEKEQQCDPYLPLEREVQLNNRSNKITDGNRLQRIGIQIKMLAIKPQQIALYNHPENKQQDNPL